MGFNKSFYHQDISTPDIGDPFLHAILSTILPDSKVGFDQSKFITLVIKQNKKMSWSRDARFFKANDMNEAKRGVCAGLTYTWYECLANGNNLIDAILKGAPNGLVSKILNRQRLYGALKGDISLPAGYTIENRSKSKVACTDEKALEKHLEFLDLVKSTRSTSSQNYRNEISSHLNALQNTQHDQAGLHTISYLSHKGKQVKNTGHIIGWTKIDDGYLLFDANKGEMFFKDINKLASFISHSLLNYVQGTAAQDFSMVFEDHYSEKDCQLIERLGCERPMVTLP